MTHKRGTRHRVGDVATEERLLEPVAGAGNGKVKRARRDPRPPTTHPGVCDRAHAEAGHRPRRVVDEKHVESPVIVVVKEDGLGRVALIGESVLLGHLFKVRDALLVDSLIDVQLVGARLSSDIAGVANVDIEAAVAVHIGNRDPRCP